MPTNPFAEKQDASTKKILIIDDEEAIIDLVRTTFELEGFQVKTSFNGRDIMGLATRENPDLILTDIMMPGGGGYEVLRTLQSDVATRKIPVIVMSGRMIDASTQAMMKSEPNVLEFMTKPLSIPRLMLLVHQVLKTMTKEEKMSAKDPDIQKNLDRFNDIF